MLMSNRIFLIVGTLPRTALQSHSHSIFADFSFYSINGNFLNGFQWVQEPKVKVVPVDHR